MITGEWRHLWHYLTAPHGWEPLPYTFYSRCSKMQDCFIGKNSLQKLPSLSVSKEVSKSKCKTISQENEAQLLYARIHQDTVLYRNLYHYIVYRWHFVTHCINFVVSYPWVFECSITAIHIWLQANQQRNTGLSVFIFTLITLSSPRKLFYNGKTHFFVNRYSTSENLARIIGLLHRWEMEFHNQVAIEVLKCWRLQVWWTYVYASKNMCQKIQVATHMCFPNYVKMQ